MHHLACIMDGNRRWAKRRAFEPWRGHDAGAQSVQTTIEFCLKSAIGHLSLYAFSIENFNRSPQECQHLFNLISNHTLEYLDRLLADDIAVHFIGERSLFPQSLIATIERIERETSKGAKLHLYILFCYGARQEIIAGIKKLIADTKNGIIAEHEINENLFERYLWTNGIPHPDLIVRTGGQSRLSNFLLYQAAYSELYFLNCLWPDLKKDDLEQALDYFNDCKRNFGS